MKEFIGAWVVPLVLGLSAMGMAGREILAFRRAPDGIPRPVMRLVRRLLGCLCILGIGALMFAWMHGLRPMAALTQEQRFAAGEVTARVIWSCLGMLALAMGLAVWDVLDNLRGLGSMVDRMSRDDLKELEKTLGTHRSENPKLQP